MKQFAANPIHRIHRHSNGTGVFTSIKKKPKRPILVDKISDPSYLERPLTGGIFFWRNCPSLPPRRRDWGWDPGPKQKKSTNDGPIFTPQDPAVRIWGNAVGEFFVEGSPWIFVGQKKLEKWKLHRENREIFMELAGDPADVVTLLGFLQSSPLDFWCFPCMWAMKYTLVWGM